MKKELANFEKFAQKIGKDGASEIGVALISFPDDFVAFYDGITEDFLKEWNDPIYNPLMQHFDKLKKGVYHADFLKITARMSISDCFGMSKEPH